MNPDTNKFEQLHSEYLDEVLNKQLSNLEQTSSLLRSDGSPVPKHWSIFNIDEEVVIKNYTFKVVYINESCIIFEPVSPVIIDKDDQGK